MTGSKNDSVIDVSIREHDGVFTVTAPGIGIEASAESRDDALRTFTSELARVRAVMAEHGFQLRSAAAGRGGAGVAEAGPETVAREKKGAFGKLSVFWQGVIFVLLLLLGINQLILVPVLDRVEKLTLYAFSGEGQEMGIRQVGRIVIDRIVDLARATEEITPERREELHNALRTIAQNSRPMIDALTSDGAAGEDGKKGSAAPAKPPGDSP